MGPHVVGGSHLGVRGAEFCGFKYLISEIDYDLLKGVMGNKNTS